MSNLIKFRAASAWVYWGVSSFIIISLIIETLASGTVKADLVAIAWGSFFLMSSYLIFIHPKVELFDEGVRITNPVYRITVGWHRVESIDTKFTMSIRVNGKTIYAWAAPAPSRYHARKIHPVELAGIEIGSRGEIRAGESPRSDSGQASHIARMKLGEFLLSGREGIESKIEYNYFGMGALGISLFISLLFYVLHF